MERIGEIIDTIEKINERLDDAEKSIEDIYKIILEEMKIQRELLQQNNELLQRLKKMECEKCINENVELYFMTISYKNIVKMLAFALLLIFLFISYKSGYSILSAWGL